MTQPYFGDEIEQTVSGIGAKVAKARAERGWSLQQLARRSGLSPASIHKVEKSGMTPTITSLMKIAAALGKSVGHFIEESDGLRPVTVIRRDERTRLHTSKDGLVLNNISGDRKSTRLNSSHANISYAVFCLKKKNKDE